MIRWFRGLFYVPKYGKVKEKTVTAHLITAVATVVLCLAAMGITAYAYFACTVTSSSNTIKTANFATNVSVQITDKDGKPVKVITSDYKSHWAQLEGNKTYFVTIFPAKTSTAKTGFVILTADNCSEKYHTQQLGKDGSKENGAITFSIEPSAETKVKFFAHWGTSSYYGYENENNPLYIKQGETVEMRIEGVEDIKKEESTEPTGETTEPAVEETETTEPEETTEATEETTEPTVEETKAAEPEETTEATEETAEPTVEETETTEPEETTEVTEETTEPTVEETETTEPEETIEVTEESTVEETETTEPEEKEAAQQETEASEETVGIPEEQITSETETVIDKEENEQ